MARVGIIPPTSPCTNTLNLNAPSETISFVRHVNQEWLNGVKELHLPFPEFASGFASDFFSDEEDDTVTSWINEDLKAKIIYDAASKEEWISRYSQR